MRSALYMFIIERRKRFVKENKRPVLLDWALVSAI